MWWLQLYGLAFVVLVNTGETYQWAIVFFHNPIDDGVHIMKVALPTILYAGLISWCMCWLSCSVKNSHYSIPVTKTHIPLSYIPVFAPVHVSSKHVRYCQHVYCMTVCHVVVQYSTLVMNQVTKVLKDLMQRNSRMERFVYNTLVHVLFTELFRK